jgi:predicted outer membrane protein
MISRWAFVFAVAGMLAAEAAIAQQRGAGGDLQQPGARQRESDVGQRGAGAGQIETPGAAHARGGQQLNEKLATWLILENHGEVALSRFAQERATTDAVKDFAQRMVRDHSEMIDKLQQVALGPGGQQPRGQQRGAGGAGDIQGGQASDIQGSQPAAGQQRGFGGGMTGVQDPFLAVMQDAKMRSTEMAQEELARHQGVKFDVAYMGQQLVHHLAAVATLQSFQQHASQDLQPLIAQGLQTTQQHLTMARQIKEQLEQQAAATARRGEQTREQ